MQTQCNAQQFEFEAVEGRAVVAAFDGGAVSSDAGALLLAGLDRGLGLIKRFAGCFEDRRDTRISKSSPDPRITKLSARFLAGSRQIRVCPLVAYSVEKLRRELNLRMREVSDLAVH